MKTSKTTATVSKTPRVRDGLKKDGTILITKRGYIMWLKKLHEENQNGTIAIISRYSSHECPLGIYCKIMGTSIYNAPKWGQKVRDFYDNKMHGMTYTAVEAVYHMVSLFGYKCSAIFYGDEEGYNEASSSSKKAPKAKQASVCVAPAEKAAENKELDNAIVTLDNGIVVYRYNIAPTSFVKHAVYEPYGGHSGLTYTKEFGKLGDITTRPISQDIKVLRLGSKERCDAVDNHYAALKSLKERYVLEAFGKDFE